ncbi:MAG: hypothetical protein ACU0DW_08405 [Shimia sp.]
MRIKRVQSRSGALMGDGKGGFVPYVAEFHEDHPYFEYVDQDPFHEDREQYAAFFREALPDSIKAKLFDPVAAETPYVMTADDFGPCEKRRLESWSWQPIGLGPEMELRRRDVADRWYCAPSFARELARIYEATKDVVPPKKELRSLEQRLRTMGESASDKETKALIRERMRWLRKVLDERGAAVRHEAGFAYRVFAYQLLHLTFCKFGEAANGSRGHTSGRGLPRFTAKATNLLFGLSGSQAQVSSRAISQWYERGSNKVRAFNLANWEEIWGVPARTPAIE